MTFLPHEGMRDVKNAQCSKTSWYNPRMNRTFKTPSGHSLNLPERWRASLLREDGHVVLLTFVDAQGEPLGYVSVDETSRGFDIGQSVSIRPSREMVYKGRGWQDRLFSDAMAKVEAIWA